MCTIPGDAWLCSICTRQPWPTPCPLCTPAILLGAKGVWAPRLGISTGSLWPCTWDLRYTGVHIVATLSGPARNLYKHCYAVVIEAYRRTLLHCGRPLVRGSGRSPFWCPDRAAKNMESVDHQAPCISVPDPTIDCPLHGIFAWMMYRLAARTPRMMSGR